MILNTKQDISFNGYEPEYNFVRQIIIFNLDNYSKESLERHNLVNSNVFKTFCDLKNWDIDAIKEKIYTPPKIQDKKIKQQKIKTFRTITRKSAITNIHYIKSLNLWRFITNYGTQRSHFYKTKEEAIKEANKISKAHKITWQSCLLCEKKVLKNQLCFEHLQQQYDA